MQSPRAIEDLLVCRACKRYGVNKGTQPEREDPFMHEECPPREPDTIAHAVREYVIMRENRLCRNLLISFSPVGRLGKVGSELLGCLRSPKRYTRQAGRIFRDVVAGGRAGNRPLPEGVTQ